MGSLLGTGSSAGAQVPCPHTMLVSVSVLMTLKESLRSDHISSVTQSCPTLCDPMNHSTPGLPVHHQLPEFTQTHVH